VKKTETVIEQETGGILVIGVGNASRCDDAAGILVAMRIKCTAPDFVDVKIESGDGAALIEAWSKFDTVILIDATLSGAPPGTIHRLNARQSAVPMRLFHYSTHAFSVAQAVELCRVLNKLPPNLLLFGIEGGRFTMGEGLTPEVDAAVSTVYNEVICAIEAATCMNSH
jgi:hydrogenase maturation protease